MKHDVLLAKIATIDRCTERIRCTIGDTPRIVINNQDKQDIAVLNLQRAIQAGLDAAGHIISSHRWGLPSSLREHFTLLGKNKVTPPDLTKRLEAMAGFRNIAVHNYETLDPEVLASLLQHHLGDLTEFAKIIAGMLTPDTDGSS